MKKCSHCQRRLSVIKFGRNRSSQDGLAHHCKDCVKVLSAKSRLRCRKKLQAKGREYYQKNKPTILQKSRNRYTVKREAILQRMATRRKESSGAMSKREWLAFKKRASRNPSIRVGRAVRDRLKHALSRAGITKKPDLRAVEILGCELSFFRKHLEAQFKDGMNWENYGVFGWHIDHIRPCASFNLANQADLKACFHFSNLQPLWREENLTKGAKLS